MSKQLYEQPTTKVLVVRFGDSILTVSTTGNTIQAANIDTWEDEL